MCFMAAFLSQTAINVESGSFDTQFVWRMERIRVSFHFPKHWAQMIAGVVLRADAVIGKRRRCPRDMTAEDDETRTGLDALDLRRS